MNKNIKSDTSWGSVSEWYSNHLGSKGTYHETVILPQLERLMNIVTGEHVLDLACGEGFFAREYKKKGAEVTAIDISKELIAEAIKKTPDGITFTVAPSHELTTCAQGMFDKISIVLAIQNIEKVKETFLECSRVLKKQGRIYIVMNHPAFRIPHGSSWAYDEKNDTEYRRIDRYMSETRSNITMNPGIKNSPVTVSFHRPIQYYTKLLSNAGFAVIRIEEWISNKNSEGKKKEAENKARKEFPLFMALEIVKLV